MTFGRSPGPPATARQVQRLLELLQEAGHTDFRDARGPMGFNQRQAGGKFTRDEVDGFIDQLEASEHEATEGAAQEREPVAKPSKDELALRRIPDGVLAAELQRRGWAVMEP